MDCRDFQRVASPLVDGELAAGDTATAWSHAAGCSDCYARLAEERRFRWLLRRQPRETAPPELRASLAGRLRRGARLGAIQRGMGAAGVVAAGAALVTLVLSAQPGRPDIVQELVAKHVVYATLEPEPPAELVSRDRREIERWLRRRTGLDVAVADYFPAGIRLVGASVVDVAGERTGYLVYRKGDVLLSVFVVPAAGRTPSGQSRLYRSREYMVSQIQGLGTVSWRHGPMVFGLVSSLHLDALLECAAQLHAVQAELGV